MEVVEESAFSPEQLLGYDKFWDIIRTETTLYNSGVRQGRAEGREEGREEGEAIGLERGRAETVLAIARKMKSKGSSVADIQELTGLSEHEKCRLNHRDKEKKGLQVL